MRAKENVMDLEQEIERIANEKFPIRVGWMLVDAKDRETCKSALRELSDIVAAFTRKQIEEEAKASTRDIPCVSCGEKTEWRCADCYIDTRKPVAVCHRSECRDKHEANGCTKTAEKGEEQAL